MDILYESIHGLGLPLLRLLLSMSVGILLANVLEALRWEKFMARLVSPLVRISRLSGAAASSFVLAFFSGHSASTILSNAYSKGEMSKKELVLANLFNSTPAYFIHLPGLAALSISILGKWGAIYIAIGMAGAILRTLGTAFAAHLILPPPPVAEAEDKTKYAGKDKKKGKSFWAEVLRSFKRRFLQVIKFTVPIYILFYVLQQMGLFEAMQNWLGEHAGILSFLRPEGLGIVALSLSANSAAAMSAAASVLAGGTLDGTDIVAALTVGSIISSPVRAFRHQLPVYAGYYPPALALLLVACNQALRCLSLFLLLIVFLYMTNA